MKLRLLSFAIAALLSATSLNFFKDTQDPDIYSNFFLGILLFCVGYAGIKKILINLPLKDLAAIIGTTAIVTRLDLDTIVGLATMLLILTCLLSLEIERRRAIVSTLFFALPLFSILTCIIWLTSGKPLEDLVAPNTSIFSISLAAQLVFGILSLANRNLERKWWHKACAYLIILPGLALLGLLNGRSGCFGFACSLVIFLPLVLRIRTTRNIWIVSTIIICVSFVALFHLKKASSEGRLLIYKCSLPMFRNHWLTGLGLGNFKNHYLDYQSQYFNQHSIDSPEALLADDTNFAFNDVYQLMLETGVPGVLILMLLLKRGFVSAWTRVRLEHHNLLPAIGAVFCLLIASLFSYPFQITPIQLETVALISICINNPASAPLPVRCMNKTLILLIITCCFFYHICNALFHRIANGAIVYSRTGDHSKAMQLLRKLENFPFDNGYVDFQRARILYMSGNLDAALQYSRRSRVRFNSLELVRLTGRIHHELGNVKQAENSFCNAVYMVPNRVASRLELGEFYLRTGNMEKAGLWLCSALEMSPKVRNDAVWSLKRRAENLLTEIEKSQHSWIIK